MEGKELSEGGFVYGVATSDSLDEICSNVGGNREEVGDDCGPSERYLSSW